MDTLPATNKTKAEPVPVSLKLKPECNRPFTHEQAMAWAREALQVEVCPFARTWADSTIGQRRAILDMLPGNYGDPASRLGYVNREWAALPIKIQAGYKSVLQRFAKWVSQRGLAS